MFIYSVSLVKLVNENDCRLFHSLVEVKIEMVTFVNK